MHIYRARRPVQLLCLHAELLDHFVVLVQPQLLFRDLFALDAITYAELKEQQLHPTVGQMQNEQLRESQHLGQHGSGYDRYWYQTRQGGKVSVCGSQLDRLEQDKIMNDFSIVAKHSDRQMQADDYYTSGDFSPYTIPLGANQQVSNVYYNRREIDSTPQCLSS